MVEPIRTAIPKTTVYLLLNFEISISKTFRNYNKKVS